MNQNQNQNLNIQDRLLLYFFQGQVQQSQISTHHKLQSNVNVSSNNIIQSNLLKQQLPQNKIKYQNNPVKNIHQSHINSKHLLIIRMIAFIYLTGIYIWAIIYQRSFLFNIIYLTMQGYTLTYLYFALALQDYFINHYFKHISFIPKSPNLKYLVQVINQIAFCAQLPITLVFWTLLFKILLQMDGMTTQIIIQNANLHAGPFICLTIDLVYNPFSFKIRRYSIVFIFGTIYLFINCVYSLTVHVIYKPIDWVTWLSYLLVVASYLMSYLCHFIGRILYQKIKRQKLQQIHNSKQYQVQFANHNNQNQIHKS